MFRLVSRVGFQLFIVAILYTCVTRSEENSKSVSKNSGGKKDEKVPIYVLRVVAFFNQQCDETYADSVGVSEIQVANVMSSNKSDIVVHVSGESTSEIESPVKLDLNIGTILAGIFIPLPCVDNQGSCVYNDLCAMAASYPCPPAAKEAGIPCKCPVQKGNYSISNINFEIPPILSPGEYIIVANATQEDTVVLCQTAYVKLGMIDVEDEE